MAYRSYRYRSRSMKRAAKKSKRNFIISLFLIIVFSYLALIWILPNFIGAIGSVKNFIQPTGKKINLEDQTATLAPPVLNIPYEATNTAQINIQGYSSPDLKVKLFIDDEEKQIANVLSDGSFTFQDIDLSLGTNNIFGKTYDEQGNESLPSKTIKVIFDNEKPPLDLSEPEDGKKVQGGRKVKFAGKTEIGAKIYINGSQVIVDKDGNFSSDQSLSDGDNNFTIRALDSAQNSNEISRLINFTP